MSNRLSRSHLRLQCLATEIRRDSRDSQKMPDATQRRSRAFSSKPWRTATTFCGREGYGPPMWWLKDIERGPTWPTMAHLVKGNASKFACAAFPAMQTFGWQAWHVNALKDTAAESCLASANCKAALLISAESNVEDISWAPRLNSCAASSLNWAASSCYGKWWTCSSYKMLQAFVKRCGRKISWNHSTSSWLGDSATSAFSAFLLRFA